MKFPIVLITVLAMLPLRGGPDRTVEETMSSLAKIVVPRVDFKDSTVEDAVDFLNLVLHAPDPPPPRDWKIRVEKGSSISMNKLTIMGKDLPLHRLLGMIADSAGADVVVGKNGCTLIERRMAR